MRTNYISNYKNLKKQAKMSQKLVIPFSILNTTQNRKQSNKRSPNTLKQLTLTKERPRLL